MADETDTLILNVALAARAGKSGDLRQASNDIRVLIRRITTERNECIAALRSAAVALELALGGRPSVQEFAEAHVKALAVLRAVDAGNGNG